MGCCTGEAIEDASADDRPRIRGCTDKFMLVLFILFWFLLILIAAFALVFGNPKRLIHGYDSFGNICGTENEKIGSWELSGLDMRKKPFLFYLDVKNIHNSLKVCVSKCPSRNLKDMKDIIAFYQETNSSLCLYDFEKNFQNYDTVHDNLISNGSGSCPSFPVYESIVVLHRCLPRAVKDVAEHVISNIYGAINSWDTVEQVLSDLYATWAHVLVFSMLAFVFSLVTISVLHFMASIVAWIFMIIISIASIACTAVLWWTYATIKWDLDAKPIHTLLTRSIHNEQAFLTFSIIATVLTIILLLLVFALRKHIGFISDLFRESAKCLAEVPSLFLQPIITFLILFAFFAFWTTIAVSLATASYAGADKMKPYEHWDVPATVPVQQLTSSPSSMDLQPRNVTDVKEHKSFTLVNYMDSTWVKYMWWVHLIGLIWTSEFILASQQMVIAGAVAAWYFKGKKEGESDWLVVHAIRRLLCYHLGSVALGSFLITIFKLPRLILMYIQTKLKETEESEVAKCCLKCCYCCFYCVECFIRFMNHNAYTVVAMQGHNFCTSARIAFNTIMNNVVKFTALNSAGDFILFLGKCIVTLTTTIISIVYLKHDENLHFYAVPVLLVAVFSFFIAHAVISLYEVVIDTLFLCLCEDSRMNRENGKWKESKLVAVNSFATTQELTPINK